VVKVRQPSQPTIGAERLRGAIYGCRFLAPIGTHHCHLRRCPDGSPMNMLTYPRSHGGPPGLRSGYPWSGWLTDAGRQSSLSRPAIALWATAGRPGGRCPPEARGVPAVSGPRLPGVLSLPVRGGLGAVAAALHPTPAAAVASGAVDEGSPGPLPATPPPRSSCLLAPAPSPLASSASCPSPFTAGPAAQRPGRQPDLSHSRDALAAKGAVPRPAGGRRARPARTSDRVARAMPATMRHRRVSPFGRSQSWLSKGSPCCRPVQPVIVPDPDRCAGEQATHRRRHDEQKLRASGIRTPVAGPQRRGDYY